MSSFYFAHNHWGENVLSRRIVLGGQIEHFPNDGQNLCWLPVVAPFKNDMFENMGGMERLDRSSLSNEHPETDLSQPVFEHLPPASQAGTLPKSCLV
jgi:hypothetical protein